MLGARRFDQIKGDFESALLTSTVDWTQTRAYALGAGGNIYVNLKGREPAGTVRPGTEYEQCCQGIAEALMTLSDPETDRPLVRRVYRREELYHGPFLGRSPDLVIQWEDYACWGRGRYDSRAPVFETQDHFDFSDQPLSGTHRQDGILIITGPDVRRGGYIEGAKLLDLAPTILRILGLSVPDYMDGTVLHTAFVGDTVGSATSLAMTSDALPSGDEFAYAPDEAAKISRRLKDLGYL
jgi:predicted AlkP superfamily phosphohydrolase/phosphomutase